MASEASKVQELGDDWKDDPWSGAPSRTSQVSAKGPPATVTTSLKSVTPSSSDVILLVKSLTQPVSSSGKDCVKEFWLFSEQLPVGPNAIFGSRSPSALTTLPADKSNREPHRKPKI